MKQLLKDQEEAEEEEADTTATTKDINFEVNMDISDDSSDTTELKPLTTALMAVNKQISSESRSIFYSNEFRFASTCALYGFLINIGPMGAQSLRNLRLLSWGYFRSMKVYHHPSFAVLMAATNVTRFTFDEP